MSEMKVLYIGVYRDQTGWGNACIDSILALDSVGVDVVPRCVKLSRNNPQLPERLLELEQGDVRGCDVVIQNVLPHMMDYSGRFARNIGYYFSETSNFRSSNWAEHLNQMDRVWTPSEFGRKAAYDSFVEVPVQVVPCAANMAKYEKSYDPLPIRDELGNSFVFYCVGEATRRKNIAAVVKAFHLEFDPDEPVELLIKTNMMGMRPERVKDKMVADAITIKEGLNLYPTIGHYKRELIIADHLTENGMMRLHSTGDCFIMPSYGEGWGVPAFDAMAFGKTPIVTDWGAVPEFMSDKEGWLVGGSIEPVFGMQGVHGDLYCGRQDWCNVSMHGLRRAMREAYSNDALRQEKSINGMNRAYDFEYQKVGEIMKDTFLR